MTALRWIVGMLIVYVVLAELRYSAGMRRRERERDLHWNRPVQPLSSADFVGRVYLLVAVFVLGCFVGGILIRC